MSLFSGRGKTYTDWVGFSSTIGELCPVFSRRSLNWSFHHLLFGPRLFIPDGRIVARCVWKWYSKYLWNDRAIIWKCCTKKYACKKFDGDVRGESRGSRRGSCFPSLGNCWLPLCLDFSVWLMFVSCLLMNCWGSHSLRPASNVRDTITITAECSILPSLEWGAILPMWSIWKNKRKWGS